MSYLHLTRTRTRERTPDYGTPYTGPLVRRESKHRDTLTLSDDEDEGADDYPYSSSHKPSRALTVRNQPSRLERYNIWSDRRDNNDDDERRRRRSCELSRTYKRTSPRHRHHSLSDDEEEREFRLRVQATLGQPKSFHHHHDSSVHFWPADHFCIEKKWIDEGWDIREQSTSRQRRRRDSFWGDGEDSKDEEKEKWSQYRRVKRTKTENVYRPLSGWRRERVVYGS